MSERYSVVFSFKDRLYKEGSPVIIEAGNLLKDNATNHYLAQIKIRSISEKVIVAIKLEITCYDVADRLLEAVIPHQLLDLSLTRNQEVGKKSPIILKEDHTRKISVRVTEVVFRDGSLWQDSTEVEWASFPKQELLSDKMDYECLKQLQMELVSGAKYEYLEYKDLWLCLCGSVNHKEELICDHCRTKKNEILSLDIEALRERSSLRLDKEEKQRKEELEKKKIEEQKRKKRIVIAAVASVFLVACILIYSNVILPNQNYKKAISKVHEGSYDEAALMFEKLGNYKETEKWKVYNHAKKELSLSIYKEAINGFSELGEFEDSKAMFDKTIKEMFVKTDQLLKNGEYRAIIRILSEKLDIEEIKEKYYQYGIEVFKLLKFDEAEDFFEKLDDYKFSKDYVRFCAAALNEYLGEFRLAKIKDELSPEFMKENEEIYTTVFNAKAPEYYALAIKACQNRELKEAKERFRALGDYKHSKNCYIALDGLWSFKLSEYDFKDLDIKKGFEPAISSFCHSILIKAVRFRIFMQKFQSNPVPLDKAVSIVNEFPMLHNYKARYDKDEIIDKILTAKKLEGRYRSEKVGGTATFSFDIVPEGKTPLLTYFDNWLGEEIVSDDLYLPIFSYLKYDGGKKILDRHRLSRSLYDNICYLFGSNTSSGEDYKIEIKGSKVELYKKTGNNYILYDTLTKIY